MATSPLLSANSRARPSAIRHRSSRYFLGLVQRARGDHDAARAAWKAAIDDAGYAQPPDGWTLPRAQQAALQRYLSAEPAR